jgi:hypothetical protein
MAIKYICDRCGAETGENELKVAELSIPPEPDLSLDLCPSCAREVRRHLVGTEQAAERA